MTVSNHVWRRAANNYEEYCIHPGCSAKRSIGPQGAYGHKLEDQLREQWQADIAAAIGEDCADIGDQVKDAFLARVEDVAKQVANQTASDRLKEGRTRTDFSLLSLRGSVTSLWEAWDKIKDRIEKLEGSHFPHVAEAPPLYEEDLRALRRDVRFKTQEVVDAFHRIEAIVRWAGGGYETRTAP